jgi:hypothetical protein
MTDTLVSRKGRLCQCNHFEGMHYNTAGRCAGSHNRCGCSLFVPVEPKEPETKCPTS